MKTVPLHGKKAAGRVALVDDGDYDLVMQYRWHVRERQLPGHSKDGPYALVNVWLGNGKYHTILMHKLITGWPMTDHVNHDGLDNRRQNLRHATSSQNQLNRLPVSGGTSRYKGVSWVTREQKWRADIRIDSKRIYLGAFASEEEAARAYDAMAREKGGGYAYLNFPEAA